MAKYVVTLNGKNYEVEVEKNTAKITNTTAAAAPAAAPAPKAAPAPEPVGTAVKAGDVILILEAIKMENDIVAPCDGTVASVAAKGTSVNTDDVLATLS